MLLVILVALTALLWFVPLTVGVAFHQHGMQADLQIQVGLPLVRVRRTIDLSHLVDTAFEKVSSFWRRTGEPIPIPTQKTIRRYPGGRIRQAATPPLRYLGRHVVCDRVRIRVAVGGWDAMQSALLCGVIWMQIGIVMGVVREVTRIGIKKEQVLVKPVFTRPSLQMEGDCMLRTRVGHIIVAGIWLAVRAVRTPGLVAWVRDSMRRKGEVGSGRASDSRPDEDGHGEPEGHGRRQHRSG